MFKTSNYWMFCLHNWLSIGRHFPVTPAVCYGLVKIATSNSFEADLPEMDPEQFSKLYTWGQNACVKFDLRTDDDMTMTLAATRKKSDTARGHQRLLRTNLIN